MALLPSGNIPSDSIVVDPTIFDQEALASAESLYRWVMHFNSTLNTVATGVAIWLIVWKSPDSMRVYKWYLLNLTVILCCCCSSTHC